MELLARGATALSIRKLFSRSTKRPMACVLALAKISLVNDTSAILSLNDELSLLRIIMLSTREISGSLMLMRI